MALQQPQDTSENEITMVFPATSYIFSRDGRISRRTSALSECMSLRLRLDLANHADELVVGVMMKTVENPQEETGNRYPEELIITPHTS